VLHIGETSVVCSAPFSFLWTVFLPSHTTSMEDTMNGTIDAALDTYFDEDEREIIAECVAYEGDAIIEQIIAKFDKMFRFLIEHNRLPTYDEVAA
jgi:hypothetical protein